MADEKKDETLFEHYHAKAMGLLARFGLDRKKRDDDVADKRAAQDRVVIARGIRVREFLRSDFWKEDLLPWLEGECSSAVRPWSPGSLDVPFSENRINAVYFFTSGKAALIGLLLGVLQRWDDEGEEAQKRQEREQKRREQREAAGLA